jgi:hypothetical protein
MRKSIFSRADNYDDYHFLFTSPDKYEQRFFIIINHFWSRREGGSWEGEEGGFRVGGRERGRYLPPPMQLLLPQLRGGGKGRSVSEPVGTKGGGWEEEGREEERGEGNEGCKEGGKV